MELEIPEIFKKQVIEKEIQRSQEILNLEWRIKYHIEKINNTEAIMFSDFPAKKHTIIFHPKIFSEKTFLPTLHQKISLAYMIEKDNYIFGSAKIRAESLSDISEEHKLEITGCFLDAIYNILASDIRQKFWPEDIEALSDSIFENIKTEMYSAATMSCFPLKTFLSVLEYEILQKRHRVKQSKSILEDVKNVFNKKNMERFETSLNKINRLPKKIVDKKYNLIIICEILNNLLKIFRFFFTVKLKSTKNEWII